MMHFLRAAHVPARHAGHSLGTLTLSVDHLRQVRKADLRPGDCLVVVTNNSTYLLRMQADGTFLVSGEWFDRKGRSPTTIRVNGCTWGGSIIKVDTLAACGLCIEFSNRVTTTPVKSITVIPCEEQN